MIPNKPNDKSNPSNYRPISLDSCLGKLCEKLILSRLNDYLKRENINNRVTVSSVKPLIILFIF